MAFTYSHENLFFRWDRNRFRQTKHDLHEALSLKDVSIITVYFNHLINHTKYIIVLSDSETQMSATHLKVLY
jgi:hypothetical protein